MALPTNRHSLPMMLVQNVFKAQLAYDASKILYDTHKINAFLSDFLIFPHSKVITSILRFFITKHFLIACVRSFYCHMKENPEMQFS
jgi:hypothetical protein